MWGLVTKADPPSPSDHDAWLIALAGSNLRWSPSAGWPGRYINVQIGCLWRISKRKTLGNVCKEKWILVLVLGSQSPRDVALQLLKVTLGPITALLKNFTVNQCFQFLVCRTFFGLVAAWCENATVGHPCHCEASPVITRLVSATPISLLDLDFPVLVAAQIHGQYFDIITSF